MTVHPPRRLRTFDGGARVYYYETVSTPPAADGVQGDWAVCLSGTGVLVYGPKTDDTTWPAGVVNNGPTGPTGTIAAWATATAYTVGQTVTFGGSIYICASGHTSAAAFRTDLGASRWTLLGGSAGQGRIESLDPVLMNSLIAWPLANRIYYFRCRGAGSISKVDLEIGIQSGNLVVAAWANNGSTGRAAAPATVLATSGSVACPAVGYAQIALGSTIGFADGDWLSLAFDNTTAKVRGVATATGASVTTGRMGLETLSAFPTMPGTPAPVWQGSALVTWLAGDN